MAEENTGKKAGGAQASAPPNRVDFATAKIFLQGRQKPFTLPCHVDNHTSRTRTHSPHPFRGDQRARGNSDHIWRHSCGSANHRSAHFTAPSPSVRPLQRTIHRSCRLQRPHSRTGRRLLQRLAGLRLPFDRKPQPTFSRVLYELNKFQSALPVWGAIPNINFLLSSYKKNLALSFFPFEGHARTLMKFLIDTNVFLWFISGDAQLPGKYQSAISNPANSPLLSSISIAEIAIKHSIGKLPLLEAPHLFIPTILRDLRISEQRFDGISALQLASLPFHHKDPFDRMLICQANSAGIPFAATDEKILMYDVEIL